MKMKKVLSLVLLAALMISTFNVGNLNVSASTDDTRYSVKYLQNGGFEKNVEKYTFSSNYSQPTKTNVPYWDTTAFEGKFEFFKNTSAHFNVTKRNYPSNADYLKVAEGDIAAELNADEESTIYQRINTVAGSTYTWGLDHRGRDLTDRMVLIIGPEQPVDPSKPSKDGQDQFVRITNWLKKQYDVEYPETGCSKKYIVYSKPFAASGKFVNEDNSDEDKNISLVPTTEINQEWSVWVISSPYCNTNTEHTVNGWSQYGTNASDDYDDIMKRESSSLGYDCTYTVPKGQTETLFAFCSYSSGRETQDDSTYGNLLDGIEFKLYQPLSTSTSQGGQGSVDAEHADSTNVTIKSDIKNGDALHTEVIDGQYCTIYTSPYDGEGLTDCKFQGAYVTKNNPDGTSISTFVEIYMGDISGLTEDQLKELSMSHFIEDKSGGKYYYRTEITSPVSVHLIYAKAPFVLYDANGGEPYVFSPKNEDGGNLVGFGDYFQTVLERMDGDTPIYVDTSAYYSNNGTTTDEGGNTITIPGKYISHAALPNSSWETNADGTSPHKFCGWSVLDAAKNLIVLNGEHTITFNPNTGTGGMVSFTDSSGSISDLLLDATHGVTLTALWKFDTRAYAQTYNGETDGFENSALGGTVEETLIPDDLRESDVKENTENINGENRVNCVDAFANAGDKIMFKATPDYANDYTFVGWYYRDDTDKEVLLSTSTSIAITVEEGKLNTYYARFKKTTVPVVFHYSSTGSGSVDAYTYYDNDSTNVYGKYFQNVTIGNTAVKPTGDSKSVKTWFTSPTERSSEYIFDFSTPITKETHLYAGPTFTYNYYNDFVFQEPWRMHTYGTLKFNGKYIDLPNDTDVTDYNVYILKGNLDESAPKPSEIKNNANTTKIGKSVNEEKLLTNDLTNTEQAFSRIGTAYENIYLFNMKTPVWVMFDFTYKGVKYTSTVKDRSLYNNITTYMEKAADEKNGLYITYPPETQDELRTAQTTLLNSIKGLYDAVAKFGISESTEYKPASSVTGLPYVSSTDKSYSFESTTAIRNIEPWGLKYSFTVKDHAFAEFDDYGAVVLTDKEGSFSEQTISVEALLQHEDAVMYSKSQENVYSSENGAIDIFYVNNLLASDFDKKTHAVFFVKDEQGNVYYSKIINNTYNNLADADVKNETSETKAVSQSIMEYSNALTNYYNLVEQAKASQK